MGTDSNKILRLLKFFQPKTTLTPILDITASIFVQSVFTLIYILNDCTGGSPDMND